MTKAYGLKKNTIWFYQPALLNRTIHSNSQFHYFTEVKKKKKNIPGKKNYLQNYHIYENENE